MAHVSFTEMDPNRRLILAILAAMTTPLTAQETIPVRLDFQSHIDQVVEIFLNGAAPRRRAEQNGA